MSKYLSLRGTNFTDFNVTHLLSLVFIDIRGTAIGKLDLHGCLALQQAVKDAHQTIQANICV